MLGREGAEGLGDGHAPGLPALCGHRLQPGAAISASFCSWDKADKSARRSIPILKQARRGHVRQGDGDAEGGAVPRWRGVPALGLVAAPAPGCCLTLLSARMQPWRNCPADARRPALPQLFPDRGTRRTHGLTGPVCRASCWAPQHGRAQLNSIPSGLIAILRPTYGMSA